MADQHTIQRWLRDVTYRPGWGVRWGGELHGDQYVIVWANEPDVCHPGRQFTTEPLFRVPTHIATADQFYDWIVDVCIPGVEQHERYEWFRVDGHHHRDPHAPGMPAFATDFTVFGDFNVFGG